MQRFHQFLNDRLHRRLPALYASIKARPVDIVYSYTGLEADVAILADGEQTSDL